MVKSLPTYDSEQVFRNYVNDAKDGPSFLRTYIANGLSPLLNPLNVPLKAPWLKKKLEEIYCVIYKEDSHGKFFLPLNHIMQKFGSMEEVQDFDQYLANIQHGKGPLEIDSLVSLCVQLQIGVQVIQREPKNDKYTIIFDIPPQESGYATFVCLFTPSEVFGGIGHWSGVSYLSYHEVFRRNRIKANQEVAGIRREMSCQIFASLQQREAALSAVLPRTFLPPLVTRAVNTTADVNPKLAEMNSDDEDRLLVEALQQYEGSQFQVPDNQIDDEDSDADSLGNLRGFVERDRTLSNNSSSGSSSSNVSSSSLSRKKKTASDLTREVLFLSKSSESFKPANLVRRNSRLGSAVRMQTKRTPDAPSKRVKRTIYLDSDEDLGMLHCLCFNHPDLFLYSHALYLYTQVQEKTRTTAKESVTSLSGPQLFRDLRLSSMRS
jgi:hypothetical protein